MATHPERDLTPDQQFRNDLWVEHLRGELVHFRDGKLSPERIDWDQASALVQIGRLAPAGLPVAGAESAQKVLNPVDPTRRGQPTIRPRVCQPRRPAEIHGEPRFLLACHPAGAVHFTSRLPQRTDTSGTSPG